MRILTYKRTHTGDPDNRGIFGINDCMGTVRNRVFDAVVGIGSKAPWSDSLQIAGKVTWVGIGPYRTRLPAYRGDLVAFEKFVLMDGGGPDFESLAPNLARRFYEGGARSILSSYSRIEREELDQLISWVMRNKQDQTNSSPESDKLLRRRSRCKERYCGPCKS